MCTSNLWQIKSSCSEGYEMEKQLKFKRFLLFPLAFKISSFAEQFEAHKEKTKRCSEKHFIHTK